jgi:hypothetical protein
MKFFNGLINLDDQGKIKDIVMIDDSFSFSCLFFAPIWFLFYKMWHELINLIFAVLLLDIVLGKIIDNNLLLLGVFVIMVANNCKWWRIEHLISRKKYFLVAVISAKNKLEAQNKLIEQIADISNSSKHLDSTESNKFFSDSLIYHR